MPEEETAEVRAENVCEKDSMCRSGWGKVCEGDSMHKAGWGSDMGHPRNRVGIPETGVKRRQDEPKEVSSYLENPSRVLEFPQGKRAKGSH